MKQHAFVFILSKLFASLALGKVVIPAHHMHRGHYRRSITEQLFPSSYSYRSGFTTATGVSEGGVTQIELSKSALHVFKGTPPDAEKEHGKTTWEAFYPEGSYSPSHMLKGGIGFYVNGTDDFAAETAVGAKEAVVGYSLMFEEKFQFNQGGKLPGGFGGVGSSAYGCSGGRQEDRDECFDLRLMWRKDGAGELYTYLPLTGENSAAQLAVPGTVAHSDYGYSVGRGSFTFPTGEWVTVAEHIKLNDPVSAYNGEVQVYINGKLMINLTGVALVTTEHATIHGIHFQTFFGGSTSAWASPVSQSTWFADVSGAIVDSDD